MSRSTLSLEILGKKKRKHILNKERDREYDEEVRDYKTGQQDAK